MALAGLHFLVMDPNSPCNWAAGWAEKAPEAENGWCFGWFDIPYVGEYHRSQSQDMSKFTMWIQLTRPKLKRGKCEQSIPLINTLILKKKLVQYWIHFGGYGRLVALGWDWSVFSWTSQWAITGQQVAIQTKRERYIYMLYINICVW